MNTGILNSNTVKVLTELCAKNNLDEKIAALDAVVNDLDDVCKDIAPTAVMDYPDSESYNAAVKRFADLRERQTIIKELRTTLRKIRRYQ